ncbi:hypothetical protein TREMEDRAFT_57326, partial [Tremella mesenterica DSM 1558]|uniref:uncharacterized protein n=1 Tax=Tremella mesenterica (strain ATCC 24925 / CBS 8224 / DSM 1558 / NBRC 9311 / NRRL Y-6157 / RJB 2259-6 / UBC 559-6) TaxID=578456 RepID=UPI0003F49F80
MSSSNLRRPTPLTIHPPSPTDQPSSSTPQAFAFPANLLASPRKFTLPPSPTYSNPGHAYDERPRISTEVSREGPPVPAKNDKRLPLPPSSGPVSPGKAQGKGGFGAGAYDNKLVSSTLSHLPPLPQSSPNSTGPQHTAAMPTSTLLHPPGMASSTSFANLGARSRRPSVS